jgi:CO/xanthine dehydrogenase FAD-binding subunit
VKAPPFAYARAASAEEALALLAEAGDEAKVLAGGQSLLPLLSYRLVRPTHLVDVGGAGTLSEMPSADGELVLDALVRHAQLERMVLPGAHGLLSEAASFIGHVPIRVRGTVGGSLAHADPAAELPVAAVALDASVVVRASSGERLVPATSFFLGPFTTALAPDELLTALAVPTPPTHARAAFAEFAVRAGDFALASAAAVVACENGRVGHIRIVLGGVDATPLRARAAEAALHGENPLAEAIVHAGATAAAECDPVSDQHATAVYRRELVAVLVRTCLTRVCGGGAA